MRLVKTSNRGEVIKTELKNHRESIKIVVFLDAQVGLILDFKRFMVVDVIAALLIVKQHMRDH